MRIYVSLLIFLLLLPLSSRSPFSFFLLFVFFCLIFVVFFFFTFVFRAQVNLLLVTLQEPSEFQLSLNEAFLPILSETGIFWLTMMAIRFMRNRPALELPVLS